VLGASRREDGLKERRSNVAHSATTLRGATATGKGTLEAVINGQLLAGPDFSETVEEDLAADSAHGQIRIAAVIDELGAASSRGSIELGARVQSNRVNTLCFPHQEHPWSAAHGFPLADPLTGVLDDPPARRDRFFGEHAKAFDAGTMNLELETGEFRVETRNAMLRRHINRAERARGRQSKIGSPLHDSF
jgi:hypothetical protein